MAINKLYENKTSELLLAELRLSTWSIWTSTENLNNIREHIAECSNIFINKPDSEETDLEAQHCLDVTMIYTPSNANHYRFLVEAFPDLNFVSVHQFNDSLDYPDLVQVTAPCFQHDKISMKNYRESSTPWHMTDIPSMNVEFVSPNYGDAHRLQYRIVKEGVQLLIWHLDNVKLMYSREEGPSGCNLHHKFLFNMSASQFYKHISILQEAVENYPYDTAFHVYHDCISQDVKDSWEALFSDVPGLVV